MIPSGSYRDHDNGAARASAAVSAPLSNMCSRLAPCPDNSGVHQPPPRMPPTPDDGRRGAGPGEAAGAPTRQPLTDVDQPEHCPRDVRPVMCRCRASMG